MGDNIKVKIKDGFPVPKEYSGITLFLWCTYIRKG